jgi:tetratricopeptide (TPR) repeat protein
VVKSTASRSATKTRLLISTRPLKLDPDDAWAIGSRGQTYVALGRYDDAVADCNHAIDVDPRHDWALAQRGRTTSEGRLTPAA